MNACIIAALFQSATIKAKTCMENNVPTSANDAETFKAVCTVLSDEIYKCMENALEKLEPCLEPEEHYLPDLFLGSFNNTLYQHCKDNGELFLGFLYCYNI